MTWFSGEKRDMSKSAELTGMIGNLMALAGQMGQAASSMTGQAAQQALQAATQIGQTAAGAVIGLVVVAASSRLIASLLYEMRPNEPAPILLGLALTGGLVRAVAPGRG